MSAIERLLLELETGSDDDRSVAHACRVELASERADHKQFVADVLHLRGEIEYLDEECKAMREALKLCLRAMTVATEDGGEAWEAANAALSLPRVVRSGDAARVRELEAALREIADKAPTEEPERYEGDNHGDSYHSGWERGEYAMAQIARAALAPKETR